MSDINDIFPGPPSRPDRPEFWQLSEIVLGQDTKADQEGGVAAVIEDVIPEAVLTYMAEQRTLHLFDSDPILSVMRGDWRVHFFLLMVASWHDAFCAGAQYERKYGKDSE